MTVICIDDFFPEDFRKFYEIHGVVTPYLNCTYTVRDVVKTRWGVGLHLNELKNPLVPLYGEGETGMKAEPNWSIRRFTNINGTELQLEQWYELKQVNKTV